MCRAQQTQATQPQFENQADMVKYTIQVLELQKATNEQLQVLGQKLQDCNEHLENANWNLHTVCPRKSKKASKQHNTNTQPNKT